MARQVCRYHAVIRSRKSKKGIQYNDHMKKDKKINNGCTNTTQKTKDLITRTPQKKTGGFFELRKPRRIIRDSKFSILNI